VFACGEERVSNSRVYPRVSERYAIITSPVLLEDVAWNVKSFNPENICRRCRRTCYLHYQIAIRNVGTVYSRLYDVAPQENRLLNLTHIT